ncbi:MAG TPA: adenylate/guanylate cyclase domain-containing protein [Actinomycetota bacterium]|nr:adenylate/guanylate cyclase domain-containing protein [Actinomycetota bacterium]
MSESRPIRDQRDADHPQTRYAKAGDDVYIAYQAVGDGPIDIVFMPNWFSNIEVVWQFPQIGRWLRAISSFSRLILLDQRGSGLSDPVALTSLIPLEERARDLIAVLDSVGVERAVILSATLTAPLACFFAATHSDRTRAIVLLDAFVSPESPEEAAETDAFIESIPETWGAPWTGTRDFESMDDRANAFFAYYRRMSMGPGAAQALFRALQHMDVRDLLPAIRVPTLVLHHGDMKGHTGEAHAAADARLLQEAIPDARRVELRTPGFSWGLGDADEMAEELQEFLTGTRGRTASSRRLATVLFTDVVASTARLAAIGDRAWTDVLADHEHVVRERVSRSEGSLVEVKGEESLSVFDGPGRAIRCAAALRDDLSGMGLEVRAGLHTGEVEFDGDRVAGMAVHIGARVAALAGAGEVLVSSTVKDLVLGSEIEFEERGEHELKGVPGAWRVFRVR